MIPKRRFLYATQAEILRSDQRDNQLIRLLSDHLKLLSHIHRKLSIPGTQSDIPAKLLYFALTSGIGNQTLGEEYTGIVQANFRKLQVQPLSVHTKRRIAKSWLKNIPQIRNWLFGAGPSPRRPRGKFRGSLCHRSPEALAKVDQRSEMYPHSRSDFALESLHSQTRGYDSSTDPLA